MASWVIVVSSSPMSMYGYVSLRLWSSSISASQRTLAVTPVAPGRDLELAAVGRPAAVLGHRLGHDPRRRVGRQVDGLGAGVLVLALAGDRDRDDLGPRALAAQVDRRVLHRQARAGVRVDPLDRGVRVRVGPLGDEVVDVVRPVLDGRVADLGARQRDDLDDRRVERVGRVDRRRAALDVVDLGALVDDDQRPLELAGVLAVDPEVGLERQRDLDALGHVHERAARPHGAS